jgi:hypothetical protein
MRQNKKNTNPDAEAGSFACIAIETIKQKSNMKGCYMKILT